MKDVEVPAVRVSFCLVQVQPRELFQLNFASSILRNGKFFKETTENRFQSIRLSRSFERPANLSIAINDFCHYRPYQVIFDFNNLLSLRL